MSSYRILCPPILLALVVVASLGHSAFLSPVQAWDEQPTCGNHGTSVVFAGSPAEAAKQAIEQEKLVFVLHVSGNFETPDYT